MVNIFRTIRKKVIKNRKISRYLLYSLGEIALIVVGIGIALGANNYVEEEKALQQSDFFLKGMIEDLASDTLKLNKMLKQLKLQLDNEQWLIDKKSFDISDVDSIKLASSSLKWSFVINNRSFMNIQNSSGSKLFGYDSLYSEISKYYLVMGNRIRQNNELETSKSAESDPFQHLVNSNLYLETREYQDYTGFGVKIKDDNGAETKENINEVLSGLTNIAVQNSLNEKFARHNYLFLSLTFCNKDAKLLIKKINEALN